jgi:hypothetical protein
MQRRDFLKTGGALAVAAELGTNNALGIVSAHEGKSLSSTWVEASQF